MKKRSQNPPASSYAARRTTAPQATNPWIRGPGRSGGGEPAISAEVGSSRRVGPTRIWAASRPRRGERGEAAEAVGGQRQGAGFPPGVVVAEGDDRRAQVGDADVAGSDAAVLGQRDH